MSYDFYHLENSFASKLDWFIFSITKYQWSNASIDISYYLALFVPFIFLILSVFFGIKMLKNKDDVSPKLRMLGIISLTISSFILLTFIILKLVYLNDF